MKALLRIVLPLLLGCLPAQAAILVDLTEFPTAQRTAVRELDLALNAHDASAFLELYDRRVLKERVLGGLDLSEENRNKFANGIDGGIQRLATNIVHMMEAGSSSTVVRVQALEDPSLSVLVRINIASGGYVYLEFLFDEQQEDGRLRIIDHFDYSDSSFISDRIKRLLPAMVPAEQSVMQKLLQRILGASPQNDQVNRLGRMMRLVQESRFDEAFALFRELPPGLQANRALAIPMLSAARRSGNPDYYAQALANIEKNFSGDEDLAYMMIDHYFIRGDLQQAESKANQAIEALGIRDAGLLLIKAKIAIRLEEFQRAEALLDEAISNDPFFQAAYYTAMDLAAIQGKFSKLVSLMEQLRSCCAVRFSPEALRGEPHYASFLESEAGAAWMKSLSEE